MLCAESVFTVQIVGATYTAANRARVTNDTTSPIGGGVSMFECIDCMRSGDNTHCRIEQEQNTKKAQRRERLLPGGIPRYVRCYDNGGETWDRYTVVYTGNFRGRDRRCWGCGMSEHPCSPQGFGQHFDYAQAIDRPKYAHLGKRIKFQDLPPDCQRLVLSDYRENWQLEQVTP